MFCWSHSSHIQHHADSVHSHLWKLVVGSFKSDPYPRPRVTTVCFLLLKISFVFLKISYKQITLCILRFIHILQKFVVEFHCWVRLGVATQTVYLPPVEEFHCLAIMSTIMNKAIILKDFFGRNMLFLVLYNYFRV